MNSEAESGQLMATIESRFHEPPKYAEVKEKIMIALRRAYRDGYHAIRSTDLSHYSGVHYTMLSFGLFLHSLQDNDDIVLLMVRRDSGGRNNELVVMREVYDRFYARSDEINEAYIMEFRKAEE